MMVTWTEEWHSGQGNSPSLAAPGFFSSDYSKATDQSHPCWSLIPGHQDAITCSLSYVEEGAAQVWEGGDKSIFFFPSSSAGFSQTGYGIAL